MSYEKKLEVIRVRKLKRKLEYLRLELEEVDFIFQHCMKTFDKDFSEYVKPAPQKQTSKDVTTVNYDLPEDEINIIYKKLAVVTHPDKKTGDKNKFQMVKDAKDRRDWFELMNYADELNVDMKEHKKHEKEFIEKSIKDIDGKVKHVKNTYAWVWYHGDTSYRERIKDTIIKDLKDIYK